MKTPTLSSVVMFVLSLGFFEGSAGAARQDPARAQIAAQARALSAAVARGDAPGVARLFTRDARLSIPGIGNVLSGREAIASFWQAAIGGGLAGIELTATEIEGEGGLRIETGSYLALGQGRSEMGRGQYIFVWKKEDGDWRIHRDFAHDDATPSAARMDATPAPDRVGFPRDYAVRFRRLGGTLDHPAFGLTTVFANDLAAAVADSEGAHFPDGAVILMEFANAQHDGEDQLLRDAHGQPLKGEIAHVDVMRRGAGFGAMYGASRAGEWEFASYGADGRTLIPPSRAGHCAACHVKAGAERDFVFRNRSWSPAG